MNNTKTARIVTIIVAIATITAIAITGPFTEIVRQHPEILHITATENPQFIIKQEISALKMAGVLIFIIVALALLGLKAATKKNRKTM